MPDLFCTKLTKILIFTIIFIQLACPQASNIECHYTCDTCSGSQYYECNTCPTNRGQQKTYTPITGMCYCTDSTDQNSKGQCQQSDQYNYNNKATIASFIGLALLISLLMAIATGYRHFFIKTIEDIQEISLIVFVNLYFPQQFDIFLTKLYRFNISSYTFQSLSSGSLYKVASDGTIYSVDGQNIRGKYQLLYKTANFFSNQFTWILVFVSLLVIAIIIRLVRNRLKKKVVERRKQLKQNKRDIRRMPDPREITQQNILTTNQQNKNNIQTKGIEEYEVEEQQNDEKKQKKKREKKNDEQMADNEESQNNEDKYQQTDKEKEEREKEQKAYRIFNRINNMVWYTFFITFFYLSLIEININIFTQIANLTFSSGFAAFGAFCSAVFLAVEILVIGLLWLKIREESIKPEWMRDYTFTAPIYMIRTNYKTVTKYFWVLSCFKKILLCLFVAIYYHDPSSAILSISVVQAFYIALCIYCEPYERRYVRMHLYIMEVLKIFVFLSLINFTQKYVSYARMIELTVILYTLLAAIFGFNFFYILISVIVERAWYIRALSQKFCPHQEQNQYLQGKLGYYSEGKVFIYERQ